MGADVRREPPGREAPGGVFPPRRALGAPKGGSGGCGRTKGSEPSRAEGRAEAAAAGPANLELAPLGSFGGSCDALAGGHFPSARRCCEEPCHPPMARGAGLEGGDSGGRGRRSGELAGCGLGRSVAMGNRILPPAALGAATTLHVPAVLWKGGSGLALGGRTVLLRPSVGSQRCQHLLPLKRHSVFEYQHPKPILAGPEGEGILMG